MTFKMKGFSPFHQEEKSESQVQKDLTSAIIGEKKRNITSDLKKKEKEPDWMANSIEIQAKKYADERYNAARNEWVDKGREGRQPLRSDFKPEW